MSQTLFKQPGCAPPLRRTPVVKIAGKTAGLEAGRASVAKQNMVLAQQPILVEGVQLHCPSKCQNPRPADERDVVEVNDIEPSLENSVQSADLEQGQAGLLGGQWREWSERAFQRMHDEPFVALRLGNHRRPAHQPVGIGTVDDLDVVPPACQFARKAAHENAVAAEVVGRIEGRNHQEA